MSSDFRRRPGEMVPIGLHTFFAFLTITKPLLGHEIARLRLCSSAMMRAPRNVQRRGIVWQTHGVRIAFFFLIRPLDNEEK